MVPGLIDIGNHRKPIIYEERPRPSKVSYEGYERGFKIYRKNISFSTWLESWMFETWSVPMCSSAPKNIQLIISQLPPLRLRYTDAISAVRSAKERVMPQHDHGFGLLWVGQSIQGHDVALKGEVASSLIGGFWLHNVFLLCFHLSPSYFSVQQGPSGSALKRDQMRETWWYQRQA